MPVNDPLQGILVCNPKRLYFLVRTGAAEKMHATNRTDLLQGIVFGDMPVPMTEQVLETSESATLTYGELSTAMKAITDDLLLEEFEDTISFTSKPQSNFVRPGTI